MSWARLDDRFWCNPKVQDAWGANRASVGLHVMAITHCAMNETDGRVPGWFIAASLSPKESVPAVRALVAAGLWVGDGDGWIIHDFLEFNESREQAKARRETDRKRKKDAGKKGAEARWNPGGADQDSERNPRGIRIASDGSRPVPSRPIPDIGVGGAMSETRAGERPSLPHHFLKKVDGGRR